MNGVANRGGWPLIWENGECLNLQNPQQKAIRQMQLSQIPKVAATFDDPNLISSAGSVGRGTGRTGPAPTPLGWSR